MWFIYIVRCADASFYTGITNNIDRRIHQHNTNTAGSKYVRFRRPAILVYQEKISTRSKALKREAAIKKMTHNEKQSLIR
jgi:predicted GIY-YIG superfamily endonuclease